MKNNPHSFCLGIYMQKIIFILSVCASSAFAATPSFGPGGQWTSGTFASPTMSGTMTGNFTRSGTTTGGTFSTPTINNGTSNALTLTGTTSGATLIISGSVAANGNTNLGDASGDTLTINAGTVTAPNATSTSSGNNVINLTTQDARFLSKVVFLTSSTTVVTNSATYTDVPGISIPLAVGSYKVELNAVAFQSVTGSVGGSKIALAFTGTASGNGWGLVANQVSTSSVSFNNTFQVGDFTYSTSPLAITTTPNNSSWAHATIYLVVTGTGNLTIQMAESTATVGQSINARLGTSLEATKY